MELARTDDDPQIRQLLADNSVPGQMALTYEREPGYFLGCSVMGPLCQTLVARHNESGQLVGVATRSVRPLYVNGQCEDVGYIGQLRVDKQHRGRWVVADGFRLFHQLHQDGRATGYVTTLIEGNREAEGILVKRARRHYPAYRHVGRLCTVAVILRRRRRQPCTRYELRTGAQVDLDDVIKFFALHGAQKQFFPAYTAQDLTGSATLDIEPEDLLVACEGGEVAGVIGLWDQSRYKQTVVRTYSKRLRRMRPYYNIGARLLSAQPLTAIDQPMHMAYASFICVVDNDRDLFRTLLGAASNRAAQRGYAYLLLGLSTEDPLLSVARRTLHIPYFSTLYTVCWPGDETFHHELDGRIPYIEIATL